ncbi:MAG: DUF4358 domain-containing protein [Clostridium sp.]|uniref:DUF4358 domain-containing protein n=1 Tax=Clostridium sp. TaxID=1506 RepID=UPI003042AB69
MKSNYNRAYCILAGIVLVTFIVLYKVLEIKEPDMVQIRQSIIETADITTMDEGDALKLRKLYYINKNDVEEFILYSPKTNMDANEILILKAKSEKDVDELKSKIEGRVEKQSNSFKSYRPEEYEIISDRVLEVKGEYLILIISKDSKEIKTAIDKNFR